jgi:hypothetical protein
MIANECGSMEEAEQNQQKLNDLPAARLLESVQIATDDERADINTPPCGREVHDEADLMIQETDEDDS